MKQKKTPRSSLFWLGRQCRGQLPLLCIVVFCNVLFAASSVALALLVREVIDAATLNGADPTALSRLYQAAIFAGLLVCAQLLLRFLCRYYGEKLTSDFELSLRTFQYRSLLSRDFGSVSSYHSGELMTRLYSDVTVIADGASTILPNVASIFTRLICAVGVMAFLEWRFTLLFIGGGLFVFVVSRLFSKKLRSLHMQMQEADGKARSFMQESFSSLLVLHVFDAQEATSARSDALQKEHYGIKLKKKLLGALAGVGFASVFKIGYFAALFYCSLSLAGVVSSVGVMTYGTLMAILQLVNQIQTPLGSLSGVLPKFYGMCASVERLRELDELPMRQRPKAPCENAAKFYEGMQSLCVSDVSFAYERENVLEHANLELNKGDFCVITGLSGIGKSTLLKLLLDVYRPLGGEIYFDSDYGKVPVSARPNGFFAYVPQGNLLFSGTIRENISFVKKDASEEEILQAARLACVTDFLDELPQGLNTYIGEKGFGLSEGQVQRISIARALLLGAPILLLDESTSALDEETEHRLLSGLSRMKDRTLIIISHKKAAFDICDYEIVLSDKQIVKKEISHGLL